MIVLWSAMTIVQFENRLRDDLTLIVQPWNESHTVPHLAVAGLRYLLSDKIEDRSFSSVGEGEIEFWCDADSYEIEIVLPSAFDRLLWDICVVGGWCGGIVNGNPAHVTDFLPVTGEVSAFQFAQSAMRADGWSDGEPIDEKHLQWLKSRFVKHMGGETESSAGLTQNLRRPFEPIGTCEQ